MVQRRAKPVLSVLATATALVARGYHPVPVLPGTKAAAVKNWVALRVTPDDVQAHFPPDADVAIGLILGTEVAPGCYPIGIDVDVDDQELVDRIRLAFISEPPAKKGAKGITFFVRVPEPTKKRYISRKDVVTGAKTNCVEVLGTGQQTVIPPSMHPDGMDYQWVGPSLCDCDPQELPELTAQVLQEIEVAVGKPASKLFELNIMQSARGKGGGTIHTSVLEAVAVMCALGWSDDQIWARVARATHRALQGDVPREYEAERWQPVVMQMVKDARAKGFDVIKPKKIHVIAAGWLLNEWRGPNLVRSSVGMLQAYSDGHWTMHDDGAARHVLARGFPEPPKVSLTHSDWTLTVKTAVDMAERFPLKPPGRRVCLLNGTVDMDTGELLPWSPDDFLISQLKFKFDPDAQCPLYESVMRRAFSPVANGHDPHPDDLDKSIQCWEEFIAHTLFECLDYHKFMILRGAPRSGKSTLIKVAQMLHGEDAVSAIPVQEFGNEKYRTAMVGKLLNVVNEVAAMGHVADDFLKSVTAGDAVMVRFLYREPQLVRLPARLLFACNEIFRVRDTSGAIEARMLVLSCDNEIPEKERDVRIGDKLRAELPGIFNRMIAAWHRLRDRGHFDPPLASRHNINDFASDNNLVIPWIKECTWEGAALDGSEKPAKVTLEPTDINLLYMNCAEWMKANGHKQISKITFGMKLSQLRMPGIDLNPKVQRVGGQLVRVRALTLIDKGRI